MSQVVLEVVPCLTKLTVRAPWKRHCCRSVAGCLPFEAHPLSTSPFFTAALGPPLLLPGPPFVVLVAPTSVKKRRLQE